MTLFSRDADGQFSKLGNSHQNNRKELAKHTRERKLGLTWQQKKKLNIDEHVAMTRSWENITMKWASLSEQALNHASFWVHDGVPLFLILPHGRQHLLLDFQSVLNFFALLCVLRLLAGNVINDLVLGAADDVLCQNTVGKLA